MAFHHGFGLVKYLSYFASHQNPALLKAQPANTIAID